MALRERDGVCEGRVGRIGTPPSPRVCEVCETRPPSLYCKNDGAFLCGVCDAEVHLSNTLSARHQVVPVSDYLAEQDIFAQQQSLSTGSSKTECDSQNSAFGLLNSGSSLDSALCSDYDNSEIDKRGRPPNSLLHSSNDDELTPDYSVFDFFSDDHHLNAASPSPEDIKLDSCWIDELEKHESSGADGDTGVDEPSPDVPTQTKPAAGTVEGNTIGCAAGCYGHMGLFPYYNGVMWHPSWSPFYSNSGQNPWPCMVTGVPMFPPQASTDQKLDRKARVARYLEKRKTRTFETKIRYASRKAYAETRPRIKGRFARREELEEYMRQQELKPQAKRTKLECS